MTILGIASENSSPQWKLKLPDMEALAFLLLSLTHMKKPKPDNELLQQSITGNIHLIQKKRALMTLHVTVSKFLKILQNDLPSKILKCTLCSIVQTTRKQRQLPATRCKSKHYSTSSQHQGVAHWPVLVYNAIVLAEVSATREPQWDSSAHFFLTFSYPMCTNHILPYGEQVRQDCYSTRKDWLGNGTWGESRYCIPEFE